MVAVKTLRQLLSEADQYLTDHNLDGHLARQYWMMAFDLTLTDIVLAIDEAVKDNDADFFQSILERIIQDEPIQYILGYADFMGDRFVVNRHTLIPREETAGIVDLLQAEVEPLRTLNILDIGTGTGILAIELAKKYPNSTVVASDISSDALEVAKRNADYHKVKLSFYQSDVFESIPKQTFDLIVSNPPYIAYNELSVMDASVKKYEPATALFATDNGLAIYKQIATQAKNYLNVQGMIVLEIGYQQGLAVKSLFQQTYPKAIVSIKQDMNGLDRYVQIKL